MGIVTKCVQCEHCKEQYRVRYNLGNKYPQSATFSCHGCGEDLTFGCGENEEILKNIKVIEFDMEIKIVNLHPELLLDASSKDDATYFPSLEFMTNQYDKHGMEGLAIFKHAQQSCIEYQEKWDTIQRDFRYLKEGRWKLLESKYGNEPLKIRHQILMEVFNTADQYLQGEWADFSDKLMDVVGQAYNHSGYSKLRDYLLDFSDDFLLNKLYEVMNSYQEVESFLLPTLLHQKCGLIPEGISSTVNWKKIQMLYGDFFEIYGDLLLVPTALNNLLARNDYNKFNTEGFTLNKYIDSDKSGRAENFKGNLNFTSLGDFYESGVRNGTHHKASTFDKNTQLITFRTGKGGKGRRHMPLVSYIQHCNELYARILAVAKSFYLIHIMKPKEE